MSSIKINNHLIPNFILKKWYSINGSKVYSKKIKDFRYIAKKDFAEEKYYGDALEEKLAKVESAIAPVLSRIDDLDEIALSNKEFAQVVIYSKIQSIRLDNVAHYIKNPDLMFPGNNNFLFGVFTTSDKNEAIKTTEYLVDLFLTIWNLSNAELINNSEIQFALSGLGIVVIKNPNKSNVMSDKAVLKEVDIDGNFLYLALPISPTTMIILSKNKYLASEERAHRLMRRNGDAWISAGIEWQFLINNHNAGEFILNPWFISRPKSERVVFHEPIRIIAALAQDSSDLILSLNTKEEIDKLLSVKLPFREIDGPESYNW